MTTAAVVMVDADVFVWGMLIPVLLAFTGGFMLGREDRLLHRQWQHARRRRW